MNERLLDEAERLRQAHASFTRPLNAPYVGPWEHYWREAARDLQRAADLYADRVKELQAEVRLLRNPPPLALPPTHTGEGTCSR